MGRQNYRGNPVTRDVTSAFESPFNWEMKSAAAATVSRNVLDGGLASSPVCEAVSSDGRRVTGFNTFAAFTIEICANIEWRANEKRWHKYRTVTFNSGGRKAQL